MTWLAGSRYDTLAKIWNKITRWTPYFSNTDPPWLMAMRWEEHMSKLKEFGTPPKIMFAVSKACWNGWPTERKSQKDGQCVLGCRRHSPDSIEHYCHCFVVKQAATRMLGVNSCVVTPQNLLLMSWEMEDHLVCKMAALLFATYAATNSLRLCTN